MTETKTSDLFDAATFGRPVTPEEMAEAQRAEAEAWQQLEEQEEESA